jgi:acetyl esterase/lipase
MNQSRTHCFTVLAVLVLAQCTAIAAERETHAETPALPSGLKTQVELREGIAYARPEGQVLKLDVAMPIANDRRYPAVVVLFGGGWISGSRTGMRERIQYVASNGYVAVAPSYRLAPKHPFPAAVADVRECVRWLRRHADEYSIDPNRIAAVGYSAGGHLACMLGLSSDADRFGPDDVSKDGTSARVQAVGQLLWPGRPVGRRLVGASGS